MSSFAGDSIDKVKSRNIKATSKFWDDQSVTNLEVLQENFPSPSHQKEDGDHNISLTVKIIELLHVFDKWLEMTATNSNSAELVKEDESVFIFFIFLCEWIKSFTSISLSFKERNHSRDVHKRQFSMFVA